MGTVEEFWTDVTDRPMNNSYLCSDLGLLLPLFNERNWSTTARATLYFIGLVYTFFGISIAADTFMCAIEKITSKTVTVKNRNPEEYDSDDGNGSVNNEVQTREVEVWNPTVANLTLMAVGSSAPEILLTLIETAGRRFGPSKLGPSTVVGSAAFNLLIITAVCISSVPTSETRRISQILVFCVTSVFSVLAYLWVLVIVKVSSPGRVDIGEGLLTLIFFPILVVVAYMADKQICTSKLAALPDKIKMKKNGTNGDAGTPAAKTAITTDAEPGTSNAAVLPPDQPSPVKRLRSGFRYLPVERELAKENPGISADSLAKLTAEYINANKPHRRLYYRILATRLLAASGSKPVNRSPNKGQKVRPLSAITLKNLTLAMDQNRLSIIHFAASKYAVLEKDTHVQLKVMRCGRTNRRVLFKYETIDGTAVQGKDYIYQTETLVFNPGETEKIIGIQIIADETKEPDEMFYVKLGLEDFADGKTLIGQNNVAMVTITESEKDAKLQFLRTSMVVKENAGQIQIPVTRRGNTKSKIAVNWKTVDGDATDGSDYFGGTGQLVFDVNEIEKHIDVEIIDDKKFEKHETFEVVLSDPSEGVHLSSKRKRCLVTILNDDETTLVLTQCDRMVEKQLDRMQPGAHSWRDQFMRAANVNGGDIHNANALDYILHLVTFGWKLLFAFIPPPSIGAGWLTFIVALAVIGLLTAIVGDLASIFGCLIGWNETITAVTLVAMGTSMPDLFASKLAACHETTADDSVGNIMGSNCVNVFLGLGIPWLLGALYCSRKGTEYIVPSGNLSFIVTIYLILSLLCISLLIVRRNVPVFGRAELGGPRITKYLCSLTLAILWLVFIVLCVLQTNGTIPWF